VRKNRPNEPFDTPRAEEVPAISAMHVEAMSQTDAAEVWEPAGMNHLILETVGRKSGKVHRVALPYWLDDDDQRIVVASNTAQPRNPAWFHNLADKSANPIVVVQDRAEVWESAAEVLTGTEYDSIWAELMIDRSYYIDYAAAVSRQIPLVRLPKS
jgi:deazaflavin-dependent oxidoreductase (nitroreductase family)